MTKLGSNIAGELRRLFHDIEAFDEDLEEINQQKSALYKEARSLGLDPKVMRVVLGRRRQESDTIKERDALVAEYERILHGAET